MKHQLSFSLFLYLFFFFNVYADDTLTYQINIRHVPHGGTHYEFPVPADQPNVYYDSNAQSIIIDGTGYVTYYDIEITSTSDWTVYVSTQVNGSYDTIDVSSLPQGEYVITIDSPTGNSFEGFFDTY